MSMICTFNTSEVTSSLWMPMSILPDFCAFICFAFYCICSNKAKIGSQDRREIITSLVQTVISLFDSIGDFILSEEKEYGTVPHCLCSTISIEIYNIIANDSSVAWSKKYYIAVLEGHWQWRWCECGKYLLIFHCIVVVFKKNTQLFL